MEYRDALDWLLSLPDWERGTGARPAREAVLLERPAALLDALGNPQTRYRSVLIAGTKGKGSTAALLESILRAAGCKTGLYTSPHLHTYRERIRVDGALISEDEFARGVGEIRPRVEELLAARPDFESFSTFEVMTTLALNYFARVAVDIAILEVGLGGRLDATNVVDADLSIITPISFDHTAVLGNALHKIANEKAGIIKRGKIVLSAKQERDASNVIAQVAREKNATLGVGERDWLWLGGHSDFTVAAEPRVGLWRAYWRYGDLHVPLLGVHQLANAALAVAAAQTLGENWGLETGPEHGRRIGDAAIRTGLESTQWFGRLEILQERAANHPLVIADGAHNGDSAEKLVAALKFHFEFENLFLIFGALRDKDLNALLAPFKPLTAHAWTLQTPHPRSRDAQSLAQELNAHGISADAVSSMADALARAQEQASPRDLICITGSLSVVAMARAVFHPDQLPADNESG
ncbi:MAG: bifunctional folylpolyglutamate synthase/dihydrofolate synthase [Chloroflexi bacterium]|nr:bifunctional folylpolyglutamate synthase/dihydrofolate synthase [Chloroflexota bacterium]